MEKIIYTVTENTPIAKDVYLCRLSGGAKATASPGQFINIEVPGRFLRRPISVYDADDGRVTIVYKVVGRGTEDMSHFEPGMKLDVLTGLGNGFDTSVSGDAPLLIGGGLGSAPMYLLAKKLVSEGKRPAAVLGFASAADVFGADELSRLGVGVTVTTVDGSFGARGFVTDGLPDEYSYVYACGPVPMMRAVYGKTSGVGGQYSFEARMGCGFGACLGCSIKTTGGSRRVCRDGPVFRREEIIWED